MKSIIEIHHKGQWHQAALIEAGGRDRCTFEYLPQYVFGEVAQPVSLTLPLSIDTRQTMNKCPAFLLDMVPQGNGRRYLVHKLSINDSDDLILPLIQHGAFNLVGRLRLDTAVKFAAQEIENDVFLHQGFTLDEITMRKENFIENLSQYGMLGAGTTGLQGASAKFMLVKKLDGLWYLDTPDIEQSDIESHWLMKLPRGRHETDFTILKNEAAYIRVARKFGLRTHGETFHQDGMLFVPRFDRYMENAQVVRLHQESLASLAGHQMFGIRPNHYDLVEAFMPYVTDPVAEIVEYLKRDLLNLALKNTDNHARNTAVQQLSDGSVRLTPVFDVAPMFIDREMILRASRWLDKKSGKLIENVADIVDGLSLPDQAKITAHQSILQFAEEIQALPITMEECGVDKEIIERCQASIEQVYRFIIGGKTVNDVGQSR